MRAGELALQQHLGERAIPAPHLGSTIELGLNVGIEGELSEGISMGELALPLVS